MDDGRTIQYIVDARQRLMSTDEMKLRLTAGDRSLDDRLALGLGFAKQGSDAPAKVKECSRDDSANTLKHKKTRAWIDVGIGLALECAGERDEK
jgi:hypothetical protein